MDHQISSDHQHPTAHYVKWRYRSGYRTKKRKYYPRRHTGIKSGNGRGVQTSHESDEAVAPLKKNVSGGPSLHDEKDSMISTLKEEKSSHETLDPDQSSLTNRSETVEEFAVKEDLIQQVNEKLDSMGRKYSGQKVQEALGGVANNGGRHFLIIPKGYLQGSPNINFGVVRNAEDAEEQTTSNQSTGISSHSGANIKSSGQRKYCLPRQAGGSQHFVSLLKEKHEREAAHEREILTLKKQKLQLEKEKFELEKEKFEFERKEKEARLEMERKELDQRILRERRQQDIIDALLLFVKKETPG